MAQSDAARPSLNNPASSGPALRWLRTGAGTYGGLAALLLLIGYNGLFNASAFFTASAIRVNLTQVALIVIVAIGMTFVIATGGIDLSVGSLMAIAGSIAPLILLSDATPWDTPWLGGTLAYIIPVLVVMGFGLANGFLVANLRIQPIIATLILFISGRGIAQVIAGGRLKSFDEPDWQRIGLGRVLGIPVQAIIMVVVVVVAAWVLKRTVFGRYVLATGGNEEAARLAGVPVARTKVLVYVLSGSLAGLAGAILAAQTFAGNPNEAIGWELSAIAAVVVGGTLLTGGLGSVSSTLIGVLLLGFIINLLGAASLNPYWQQVIRGLFLLVVVTLQVRLVGFGRRR